MANDTTNVDADQEKLDALGRLYDANDPLLSPEMRAAYERLSGRGHNNSPPTDRSWTDTLATGPAKAVGSGVLHDFVPGIVGTPQALGEMLKTPEPQPIKKPQTLSGLITGQQPEEISPKGNGFEEFLSSARRATDPWATFSNYLPSQETTKEAISKVIPEYEPQNKTEEYLKTISGFLPYSAMAPEAWVKDIPKIASTAFRYGVSPALGYQAAGDLTKGTPYQPYAQAAATFLAPGVARKGMSINYNPELFNSKSPIGKILENNKTLNSEGVDNLISGQMLGDNNRVGRESFFANSPGSGTSAGAINQAQQGNLVSASLKHAGVAEGGLATSENMNKMVTQNSNEFERLTGKYAMPWTGAGINKKFEKAVKDYNQTGILLSEEPSKVLDEINQLAASNKGGNTDFLTGRQYQNIRSRLGNLSVENTDPRAGIALRDMRDALDDAMDNVIKHYGSPDDVGAFGKVRDQYHNQLIVQKAAGKVGQQYARGLFGPDDLSGAIKSIDGERELITPTRPISKLARAASANMTPLDEGRRPLGELPLALTLGMGAVGGAGATDLVSSRGEDDDGARSYTARGLGDLAGGVVGALLASRAPGMYGRLKFSPKTSGIIRALQTNQIAPVPLGADKARQLLTVKALMKRPDGNSGEATP